MKVKLEYFLLLFLTRNVDWVLLATEVITLKNSSVANDLKVLRKRLIVPLTPLRH